MFLRASDSSRKAGDVPSTVKETVGHPAGQPVLRGDPQHPQARDLVQPVDEVPGQVLFAGKEQIEGGAHVSPPAGKSAVSGVEVPAIVSPIQAM